uniref:Uncharacterized protein n=1 Tax=Arundo donax TaxID=35708 RepID=A0A0A9H4H2_ARUDO
MLTLLSRQLSAIHLLRHLAEVPPPWQRQPPFQGHRPE